MSVGIDIGTGSVRSYTDNFTAVKPIQTIHHGHNIVTQSSKQIFDAIIQILPPNDISSICFTATCSMVVKRKIIKDGVPYLGSYNCGTSSDESQDIILWMDGRSHTQCHELNSTQDGFMKNSIDKFIPELGIPKLLWLSDNCEEELYCFELYDWFNYVFQVGYCGDIVPFKLCDFDYSTGNAIDGSIKGWTSDDLKFVKSNIKVGKSESTNQTPKSLLHLGEYIGEVYQGIVPNKFANCKIYNGCIDCYAGWVCTVTDIPRSVSMIAGTLTCFIFETGDFKNPIDGIWGPFELVKDRRVYSFGQPATGKLFEDLFQEFDVESNGFEVVENLTSELESQNQQSITELIKNYHYYGDKYGNRSPLMNFNMDECYIDGKNNGKLGSVFLKHRNALVIRYNLILEFLSYQTHQMLESLPVDNIIISGSQVKNSRFLRLLHIVCNKEIYVLQGDHSLDVAKGAMQLANNKGAIYQNKNYKKLEFKDVSPQEKRILEIKRENMLEFVALQIKLYNQLNQSPH